MATGYQLTRPDTDQVKFTSERTGEWLLEDYLQAAELGNRPLAELLTDLFNPTTGVLLVNPTPEQVAQSFQNAAEALASSEAAAISAAAAAQSALDLLGVVTSVNGMHGDVTLPPPNGLAMFMASSF